MPVDQDFSARLGQSALDKLLSSSTYPLTVSEKSEAFPGCDRTIFESEDPIHFLSEAESKALFSRSVSMAGSRGFDEPASVDDQLFAAGGKIIEQYKQALDASTNPDYEGPDPNELRTVVDGGIENLPDTLGDWGAYAWCPYLRVRVMKQPKISLRSPRIDLNGFQVQVKAKGELWLKFPWLNCYRYCFKWKKVIKCERAARITVSVTVDVDAHVDMQADGSIVYAKPFFDRLRLAYDILDLIPLEHFANAGLINTRLPIYDASQLVATIPVLESKFGVGAIELPADASGVTVIVQIDQI